MYVTPPQHTTSRRGFTLVELAIVILIIGLLFAFILAASWGSVEQARNRATQALITKLEVGVNERLNAILSQAVVPNGTHAWLAAIGVPQYPNQYISNDPLVGLPWGVQAPQRAQVIAQIDFLRRELPDVFFIQTVAPANNDYPVNFAGVEFPDPSNVTPAGSPLRFVLPLGHNIPPGYTPASHGPPYTNAELDPDGDGKVNIGPGDLIGTAAPNAGEGIYGASYNARAALHKSIGLSPTGTDAADNDGDGFVDEFDECTSTPDGLLAFNKFLANHKHQTARAEMLYALLVNGSGPLGSVFEASEFREGVEVKDTDNDGAREFVDAWGQPIQFFRWPIFYYSPAVQKGAGTYSPYETRARFPLDPGASLVAPAWWSNYAKGNPSQIAPVPQLYFEPFFTSLTDPNWVSGTAPQPTAWDFSGISFRREFGCKFLILSAGPDQQFGVALLSDAQVRNTSRDILSSWLNGYPNPPSGGLPHAANGKVSTLGVIGESYAVMRNGYPLTNLQLIQDNLDPTITVLPSDPPPEAGDDISNHELLSQGGGLR